MEKHESILVFLARLSAELDPHLWTVVDHWDADLCAIGIARRDDPGTLVYVSTYRQPAGEYYCELEAPPSSDADGPYRPVAVHNGIGFSELLRLIREHLSQRGAG